MLPGIPNSKDLNFSGCCTVENFIISNYFRVHIPVVSLSAYVWEDGNEFCRFFK